MAEPQLSVPSRPRLVLVGPLEGLRAGRELRANLDTTTATPEDMLRLLPTSPPDALVLDASVDWARVEPMVKVLAALDDASRPAVVLFAPQERRPRPKAALLEAADDVLSAAPGDDELLSRLRRALRFRDCVEELSRKNAELEALYHRLETLAGRMAEELRLASNVQRSLLPAPVQHARLELAREFIPFREIGGDYYDFLTLGPHRLALAIGDVMGKGVPAALLSANLKASVRAQLQSGEVSPGDLVARVNRLFWDLTPNGLFASLFFAVFDLETGTVDYVNAGHHYPFVVRADGTVEELREGGTLLGLVEESSYLSGRVAVRAEDMLVFYTDGVTDRGSREGEMYGAERLKEAAARNRKDPARIGLYSILGEVQGWSGGLPAEDDATLVVAKVR
ncbi:MAG TPA: PP2C family protein-serine/threonine phosphatase [Vicinamibacteria bacterium]|nr:PP2C family protein-serine/threonine phosphatase [Vicinamibacteria bacterium]